MAQLSKVLKVVCWAGSVPFPQCPCRGRLFVNCCGRCSCVHLSGEPVSSSFLWLVVLLFLIDVNNVCL